MADSQKPDNDDPLDPTHLSPLNRARFIGLGIIAAPFLALWFVLSWIGEKISAAFDGR